MMREYSFVSRWLYKQQIYSQISEKYMEGYLDGERNIRSKALEYTFNL